VSAVIVAIVAVIGGIKLVPYIKNLNKVPPPEIQKPQDPEPDEPTPPAPPQTVAVTAITISGGATTVLIGGQLEFRATCSPANATNQNIVWSIRSGGSYATLFNGTLTAKQTAGISVRIRAAAYENRDIFDEKTVTIIEPEPIEPPPPPPPTEPEIIAVTNISLAGVNSVMAGDSFTINATVSPSNATDKSIRWEIDGIDNPTNTFSTSATASNGTVTICAVSVQNPNIYAEKIVTIKQVYNLSPTSKTIGQATGTVTPRITRATDGDTVYVDIATTKNYLKLYSLSYKFGNTTTAITVSNNVGSFTMPHGTAGGSVIFIADFYTPIPLSSTNATYTANKKLSAPRGYITDQSNFSAWTFDGYTLQHDGCGIIGVYNGYYAIGIQLDLAELICYYEITNGAASAYIKGLPGGSLLWAGLSTFAQSFGSMPNHIVTFTNYLKTKYSDLSVLSVTEYSTESAMLTAANNMASDWAMVITKWNGATYANGAHTFAFRLVGDYFYTYNCIYDTNYVAFSNIQDTYASGSFWQTSVMGLNVGSGAFVLAMS